MTYFVTGATGFIGRFLVQSLLQRGKGTIYVLVRPKSVGKLDELREFWGKDSVKRVVADQGRPRPAEARRGQGRPRPAQGQGQALLPPRRGLRPRGQRRGHGEGEHRRHRGALEFAEAVNAGCFHLVSSIAAAGLYRGTFTEDMFEEAEELDHPYYRTKHDSEGLVRANGRMPFRVYRPGIVLGIRRPASSTRSTARTTSSRRCRSCASRGRAGSRSSASKAATSTSCRSTTSSTRWCTSRTSRSSTAAAST
jgi:nucleoside-diphosphate-sugar epimerase